MASTTKPTEPVQTPEDPPVAPDEQGNDDGDTDGDERPEGGNKPIKVEEDPSKWIYPEGMSFTEEAYPDFPTDEDGGGEPEGVISPDLQKKAESAAKGKSKP